MEKAPVLASAVLLFATALSISAQANKSPLDDYMETAKVIIVAKCVEVGPVNILLRAHVRLEVLHVVTGDPKLKEYRVDSQYGMSVGNIYLVSVARAAADGSNAGWVDDRNSVIPVASSERIETLRTLSPRIVVLRTMNLRIDHLESEIRIFTYELEALKAVKKGN